MVPFLRFPFSNQMRTRRSLRYELGQLQKTIAEKKTEKRWL